MLISDWSSDVCSYDLMQFSDTQVGLRTGLVFALFYAAMGVPVAMIADRWNRVKLIGIACVVWSGFTAACGMVSNFWQLALMLFGVGAGEAGRTAPALSVIADIYPSAQGPLAIRLFTHTQSVAYGKTVSVPGNLGGRPPPK